MTEQRKPFDGASDQQTCREIVFMNDFHEEVLPEIRDIYIDDILNLSGEEIRATTRVEYGNENWLAAKSNEIFERALEQVKCDMIGARRRPSVGLLTTLRSSILNHRLQWKGEHLIRAASIWVVVAVGLSCAGIVGARLVSLHLRSASTISNPSEPSIGKNDLLLSKKIEPFIVVPGGVQPPPRDAMHEMEPSMWGDAVQPHAAAMEIEPWWAGKAYGYYYAAIGTAQGNMEGDVAVENSLPEDLHIRLVKRLCTPHVHVFACYLPESERIDHPELAD